MIWTLGLQKDIKIQKRSFSRLNEDYNFQHKANNFDGKRKSSKVKIFTSSCGNTKIENTAKIQKNIE